MDCCVVANVELMRRPQGPSYLLKDGRQALIWAIDCEVDSTRQQCPKGVLQPNPSEAEA